MGFIKRVATFGFGAIVGSGIGAAVASVLAPQSGQDLQRQVSGLMDEAKANGAAAEEATRTALQQRFREQVNDSNAFTGTQAPATD